ncbi:hypothetical protein PPL_11772 [Heterostelium album PN500]|uniref:Uncharacterized protein n=1 Tax=Heterostelium pallidum (strain ATCC 26659 / Pp 5 / PN500) TaxID=670386 RepID=D3BUF3_HETP5|nr:hypothetical protein PPL_11772 [Heterostelium album PN500]EFA74741.1 hypothetical protein PPL_11772 [Heterostelium album PN500]|eukprot:XP_020426875.1 hypothetical protein PPL_11772 [Heterostelium album PN500]
MNDNILFKDIPHILLKNISNFLDDNIDKICMSLVCKRWFNDRDNTCHSTMNRLHFSWTMNIETSIFDLINHYSINRFNQRVTADCKKVTWLPKNIRSISFDYYNNLSFEGLYDGISNSNIEEMIIWNADMLYNVVIPPKIKTIRYNQSFNLPLSPGYFPEGIEKIFGSEFNQPILPGILPANLRFLEFSDRFEKMVKLELSTHYPIRHSDIPQSVKYLKIDKNFSHTHDNDDLEPSEALELQHLYLSRSNLLNDSLRNIKCKSPSFVNFIGDGVYSLLPSTAINIMNQMDTNQTRKAYINYRNVKLESWTMNTTSSLVDYTSVD